MPTMKGSTSIAANATNANVLDGADYEFLGYDALLSLYAAQSATGLELDFKATAEALAAGIIPNIAAAAGRVQQDTDAVFSNEPVPAGKRLKLVARNTTGGALTLHWWVEIDRIFNG